MLLAERLLMEEQYKLSSTQVNLPDALGDFLLKWGRTMIPTEDLFYDDKGGCGRETEMHVTVLYGLTDPEPPDELRKLVNKTRPFTVTLGNVSMFENEKYDVLKVEVTSEELVKLSNAIRVACDNENKFPKYIPHCTLAYVKKGRCKDVVGMNPFDNEPPVEPSFDVNEILFKGAGDSEDPERVVARLPFDRYTKEAENPKHFLKKQAHTGFVVKVQMYNRLTRRVSRLYYMTTGQSDIFVISPDEATKFATRPEAERVLDRLTRAAGVVSVAVEEAPMVQESEQSPFDNLPFPSEASVLAAKLLELSTAQKPGLL